MPQSPRPQAIVRFELLGYFTILFGFVASTWANWQMMRTYFTSYPGIYPGVIAVGLAIQFAWIWMIAHKRRKWACWVSIVVIALAIIMLLPTAGTLLQTNPAALAASFLTYLLWAADFSLIFKAEAKAWFVFPSSSGSEIQPLSSTGA